ncbi:MAG: NYN domain-containing protein [Planctomycetales bacterium]|nr:NYN domain-containing protein [Planctomycetales bacterium]
MILLDAYNWLLSSVEDPDLPKGSLEAYRERGLRLLAAFAARSRDRLVAVFDGARDARELGLPSRDRYEGVEIVFSAGGRTADEEIVRMVRAEKRPGEVRVVTSDAALARSVRSEGAGVLSSRDFAEMVADALRGRRPPRAEKPEEEPDVAGWEKLFREAPPREEGPPRPPRAPGAPGPRR